MPYFNLDSGIIFIIVIWFLGILVALFSRDPNKPK
jgi:hypothetical protein